MKSRVHLFSLIIAALFLTSCMTSGAFVSSHNTSVELSEANYEVVAANIQGTAKASYLLGFSYSYGIVSNSVSLARVGGSAFLYQDAIADLWSNYEMENGSVEGEKLALTNVRYDSDILNLLVYNEITLSVRADIVKFTG
jgi:hypothetical protein